MDPFFRPNVVLRSLAVLLFSVCLPNFVLGAKLCSQVFSLGTQAASRQPSPYRSYLEDTHSGLELMRNPETGLLRDKIEILPMNQGRLSIKVVNENTSPTNIGLDLINQIGALTSGKNVKATQINLEHIISSLERAHYHKDSGLFYSWYSTAKGLKVVNSDVSSVDNIHLALALWTLKETFPNSNIAYRSGKLFERMDFSLFYDRQTGLIGGNLKNREGVWTLEDYRFSNLGSEARSIYSLCWALGLIRNESVIPAKSIAALKTEIYNWNDGGNVRPILKTWDGGAFQLLLPRLLLNEEIYSPQLAQIFKNYADYTIAEGDRQGIPGMSYHSASQYGFDKQGGFTQVPAYQGKAGLPNLVSSDHVDIRNPKVQALWDLSLTPHAAVMTATINPARYEPILSKIEGLRSGSNRLYQPGLGFMDGYHVKGLYKGQVVPVQISLDQGMIEMALQQIAASDGLSPSARALKNNPEVFEKLSFFYDLLDRNLERQTKQH